MASKKGARGLPAPQASVAFDHPALSTLPHHAPSPSTKVPPCPPSPAALEPREGGYAPTGTPATTRCWPASKGRPTATPGARTPARLWGFPQHLGAHLEPQVVLREAVLGPVQSVGAGEGHRSPEAGHTTPAGHLERADSK